MAAASTASSTGSTASTSVSSTPTKSFSLFSSSSAHLASVKLDRTNYLLWEYVVSPLIEGNELDTHISGLVSPPPRLIPASQQKGFKCLSSTGKVYVSRHVIFDPNVFPCLSGFLNRRQHQAEANDNGHIPFVIIDASGVLGIEIYRDNTGFVLNQIKYVLDLLKRFKMSDCAAATTHMVTGKQLSKNDGELMKDPSIYHQAVGSLQTSVASARQFLVDVGGFIWFVFSPLDTIKASCSGSSGDGTVAQVRHFLLALLLG
ncbi:Copia protein [Senna tora]|uniref:Copia protein n=1 Tax=Senna tora TaxID=362788 RepID=A0A834WYA6_9FABA|nr:Copia protein [Senna tora]